MGDGVVARMEELVSTHVVIWHETQSMPVVFHALPNHLTMLSYPFFYERIEHSET